MDALKALSKDLGYPSGDKLWRAVERKGLQVTRPEVLAYAQAQGQRQIFAARPKYNGKIVGTRINDRWAADLIDYTTKPSRGKDDPPSQEPYQYILIVQDVFSRKLWAVSMRVKTPEFVQQAFEHIVRSGAGVPRELDTDDRAEFKGPFEAYLKNRFNTASRTQGIRTLAECSTLQFGPSSNNWQGYKSLNTLEIGLL